MDLNRYFLPEQRIILENISYEARPNEMSPGQVKLGCKDTILAQLSPRGVKINFNRALNFEPEGVFSLSVTFSVFMLFNPETKDEVDWKSTDIAGEFRRSGAPVLTALMSRTSLLVAEITSAAGQNPIITPPSGKTGE